MPRRVPHGIPAARPEGVTASLYAGVSAPARRVRVWPTRRRIALHRAQIPSIRGLSLPGRHGSGHLCRQGEVAAAAAVVLLPGPSRRSIRALRRMVRTGASVEWTVVANEVEALQLEYSWIKEFDPRFNVRYRDDKSYPFLAVTLGDEFPRAQVMRGAKRRALATSGPTRMRGRSARPSICSAGLPGAHLQRGFSSGQQQSGRPCLLGYIDKCSAPCVGRVTRAGAPRHRPGLLRLHGRQHDSVRPAHRAGHEGAAAELEFERAAGCATTCRP
jgi:hypothetical protein